MSYCENYPTVNIEAMSCGTPVLTYKTGGSPEIVEKYGGIVVEQGDIELVNMTVREVYKKGKKESVLINLYMITNRRQQIT